jgi:hypothetical protein
LLGIELARPARRWHSESKQRPGQSVRSAVKVARGVLSRPLETHVRERVRHQVAMVAAVDRLSISRCLISVAETVAHPRADELLDR